MIFYYYGDIRRFRKPVIELLFRTIGYLNYTNVYSKCIENIYTSVSPSVSEEADKELKLEYLNVNTFGFSDAIETVKTCLQEEIRRLEDRKFEVMKYLTIVAVVTAIIATVK